MKFNSLLNEVLQYAQKASTELKGKDTSQLGKLGGVAGAAGLLGALLGRKGGARTLVKIGSVAALGALAYQAYQKYNADKSPNQNAFIPEGAAAEAAGKAVLRAMIAAAASDGEIDEQERRLIIGENSIDAGLGMWLEGEFARPAAPAEIAKEIGNNPALAAEAYLAARMVCADLSRKEIVFLAEFANALKLDDELVEQLEKQAGF